MRKKQKKNKQTSKITNFRFWNNGIEYICEITSSIEIPKYRLKEAFDRNFVGKKDINILKTELNAFRLLDESIVYEVKPVKELENVR